MSRKAKIILAGALVTALLVAGVGGAVVLAQGPTPTPGGGRAALGQFYLQALASRLGTTLANLQQAMTGARTDAIDNAVKQGLITQAQADKMLQAQNNRPLGGVGPFFRGGQRLGQVQGFFGADVLEAVGKALNMTPADVVSALRSGKTLANLAQSQNVDPTVVQNAIANAEKSALDRAVADGLITPDQANQRKAAIDPSKINLSAPRLGFFGRFNGKPRATPTP